MPRPAQFSGWCTSLYLLPFPLQNWGGFRRTALCAWVAQHGRSGRRGRRGQPWMRLRKGQERGGRSHLPPPHGVASIRPRAPRNLRASPPLLKILQARLQQYVNRELADVQAGFRKGRGTRSNCQHLLDHGKSERVPEKHLFLFY